MNKSILVDQDGVFTDFVSGFYDFAESYYPETFKILPPRPFKHFYIHDNIEDENHKQLIRDLVNHEDLFFFLKPIPGAINGIKALRDEADKYGIHLNIVTAPHTSNNGSYSGKAWWIEKYLGKDWLDCLVITPDKTTVSGAVLIDDKPSIIGKNYYPVWKHFIFDQSYNREVNDKPRMLDWSKFSRSTVIDLAFNRYYEWNKTFINLASKRVL